MLKKAEHKPTTVNNLDYVGVSAKKIFEFGTIRNISIITFLLSLFTGSPFPSMGLFIGKIE